jgi:hypothetical protein
MEVVGAEDSLRIAREVNNLGLREYENQVYFDHHHACHITLPETAAVLFSVHSALK